ncbi:glutathione S-transferase family protein [Oceanomicrobium pacificus]|uniref:Glutathione S-transferase n=1 Tax=Oceanomicrobium pacificus TaxID=2692916 RepID=A0A6B0TUI7_9RHOB|nr:glutathione S-transferase family protein [Oceanomicrobium pacificus]MXU64834.1 glutathione S-transferase [Oceanomicrobium pacificus]
MYKLVGTPRSRTIRVAWALEELEQPYDWIPAGPRSEEARALNGTGKIPVLVADGEALSDSVAIIQFLADGHGGLTHAPGSIARARQDAMTQFACEEVEGPLWTMSKARYVHPEEMRMPEVEPVAQYEFGLAMKTLAARLGDKDYVTGDAPTVPDLILGHCGGWAVNAVFAVPDGIVADYFKRVRSRPALARAMERAAAFQS